MQLFEAAQKFRFRRRFNLTSFIFHKFSFSLFLHYFGKLSLTLWLVIWRIFSLQFDKFFIFNMIGFQQLNATILLKKLAKTSLFSRFRDYYCWLFRPASTEKIMATSQFSDFSDTKLQIRPPNFSLWGSNLYSTWSLEFYFHLGLKNQA